ncbi:hypothetical protein BDB00DRAFT_446057 [Zychaea mexicana]|uniref:uncharacterized protein n=1 Tax=Zychaea mexicana TaxID=64656 RepID=UPI0022FE941A|nr:uncharacterized protein BDB00DRAFT_446057 [Zychaea mexicana]KAI9498381.1 hypothetical protein BDB00DRAFT_446057 [Zychaea mexicana]
MREEGHAHGKRRTLRHTIEPCKNLSESYNKIELLKYLYYVVQSIGGICFFILVQYTPERDYIQTEKESWWKGRKAGGHKRKRIIYCLVFCTYFLVWHTVRVVNTDAPFMTT